MDSDTWFFAWMGGFMLYVNGKPQATFKTRELKRFIHEGSGDALSKGIAILQLLWFILQLVAQYVQNLLITLLELDTPALAALAGIAYGLWWKKPKDIRCPYAVCWKTTASRPRPLLDKYVVNVLP
ncbi:hypothetical protein BD769DRAFT_1669833 [Suillus cothurnatus]|nr:hypothetical protein BD769DRAFT_1669833 [Suillus cothurnatus]